MNRRKSDTAILIFSRTAKIDAAEKKLLLNQQKGEKLSILLIEHTRRIVNASRLPYFFYSEKQQVGNTFGERLTHAIESIFSKGYQNIICIGNDCPTLQSSDLLKAHQALSANVPTVLGKTADGGVYLIGYRQTSFNANAFKNIAWQTPSVFSALLSHAQEENFKILELAEKEDIDSRHILINILKTLPYFLKKAILYIIYSIKPLSFKHSEKGLSISAYAFASLRAPPLF